MYQDFMTRVIYRAIQHLFIKKNLLLIFLEHFDRIKSKLLINQVYI